MRTVSAVLLLGNMSFSQERTSDQALLEDDTGITSTMSVALRCTVYLALAENIPTTML